MPKLGVFSGHDVCSILAEAGFAHVRTRGSHAVMQHVDAEGVSRTVPVPLHGTMKKGTLKAIIRQSGLAQELFMK